MEVQPRMNDQKAARMKEIAEAALEEFFENGFAAARLDAIAERAGVGKGTIYLYFPSKEALFEEAVRQKVAPVLQMVEGYALNPQGSATAILRAMIETFYREMVGTKRRRLLRLFIAEGPRFPNLLEFYHREVVSRGIAALRHVLRYGVERGEFRETAALAFPQTIIGPAILAAIWKMLFEDFEPLDLDALCDAHLDILLNGLAVPPRKE